MIINGVEVNFFAAFLPALAAGLIVCLIVWVNYHRKLRAPIYPLSDFAKFKLVYTSDTFVGKHVTRQRIERPNNQPNH